MIFIEWLSSYRKCKSSEPSCFTLYQKSFEDVHLEAKSIEFHMPHCEIPRPRSRYLSYGGVRLRSGAST